MIKKAENSIKIFNNILCFSNFFEERVAEDGDPYIFWLIFRQPVVPEGQKQSLWIVFRTRLAESKGVVEIEMQT